MRSCASDRRADSSGTDPLAGSDEVIVSSRRVVSLGGALGAALAVTWTSASGQWLDHKARSIPRHGDGKPNLQAPAPRTPDGRLDPQPGWMGYSVGRWDGDVLVVETSGFNDQTWLDGSGHPHSEEMRLTERFTRQEYGHMDIGMVIDDPKAYTRPLTDVQPQVLLPDTDLLEYVCAENAKPIRGAR
jgi:hypothetical protein